MDNSPYFTVRQPQGAALLNLEWPLYDGGLLQNKLKLVESQRAAAADNLQGQTDQALREVALAYDQVETGLRQYSAALALQTASAAAFRSASDSYTTGVGTLTDAATAQTGLASARAAVARAHAQSLINGAALAFAAGSRNVECRLSRPPCPVTSAGSARDAFDFTHHRGRSQEAGAATADRTGSGESTPVSVAQSEE